MTEDEKQQLIQKLEHMARELLQEKQRAEAKGYDNIAEQINRAHLGVVVALRGIEADDTTRIA
jgi:hypothetical protein